METLVIQVNCKSHNRDGPPQLGITVEAPYLSVVLQQRQQQQAKDYRNHDYQNCHIPNGNSKHNSNSNHNQNGITSITSSLSSSNNNSNNKQIIGALGEQTQRGLQITQIQEGSVIDRNGQFRIGDIIVEVNGVNLQRRTFQEAQKTLREFVVKQSSHGPLLLKVFRKATSSSSLPSTTGSQATVIERNNNNNNSNGTHELSPSSTATSPKKSTSNSASTPSPRSSSSARHFAGALNTRRIGTKYRIRLTKSNDGGFGIKIAERDNMFGVNRPIYITAITTTGSAYRDGRLKEGDMLLEVNGADLSGKSQPEVTKMLKGVAVNESVEFVVSRQEDLLNYDNHYHGDQENNNTGRNISTENGCDNNKSLIDLDVPEQEDFVFAETTNHQFEKKIDSILNVPNVDGPGTYVYDIPLNDTKSAGLGLYLKYPTLERKDLGIWIEKVITGGAAWKDGRLQPDDQILAINGINLMGLSNAEASETLTAAVCRGIGPEATSNTIRLNIHRRPPSIVAKILHGTNTRIEHSDLLANGHNKSYSISDKMINSTQYSYQTAFDNTIHSRSQSSNDTSGSNRSSNQNSHNDSAMSPQTQASNSIKLSNSCNDKSDHNSSDKTNDTSSAISQITDFTTVPNTDNVTPEKDPSNTDNLTAFTLPKTLEVAEGAQLNIDPASSIQSWDDESIDATTGEERFQRDGFGRQSISEKRHAQLMAKNTDTYKRNQKLREERERQRQIEEQLERQRLDDNKHHSLHLHNNQHQRLSSLVTTNDINSMYGKHIQTLSNKNHRNDPMVNHHREVPVDVQLPVEPGIEIEPSDDMIVEKNQARNPYNCNDNHFRGSDRHDFNRHQQRMNSQAIQMNRCWKCGSVGLCICRANSIGQRPLPHVSNSSYDNQVLKRSNSFDSIQHPDPVREGLTIPRAGTVRVARNRKINESFRAAVDRSYEGSMNDSGRFDYSNNEQRRSNTSFKITNSVANSTTSTSNDERYLISNNTNGKNNNASHKKSSSLLTRFLKFGSMKKDKKKNKDGNTNVKLSDVKALKDTSNRESETTRSQTSKGSHSRTQSSQSHPNSSPYNQQYQQHVAAQMKTDGSNSQLYNHNMKQVLHPHQAQTNSIDLHHQQPNRASMHMYQYQPMHNVHTQNHMHNSIVHSKLVPNVVSKPTNMMNNQQYSHVPIHHQGPPIPASNHPQHHHQLPIDIHSHPFQFQAASRNHMIQNPHIRLPNGCHPPNQWQSPPVHAPNGLWVANSPVSEGQIHHHNIYAAHTPHVLHMHNQQPSVTMSHPTPFIPPINGQNSNGIMHHSPILQGNTPSMTRQHLHNQQPQHIYYYDF